MKKKTYRQPTLHILELHHHPILLSGSGIPGTGVHDDDPQDPGNAMTREYSDYWDDDCYDD